MRTQDEIADRFAAVASDDYFGWQREVLLDSMDFGHAQPYLKPEVTEQQWRETEPKLTDAAVAAAAADYMEFAWGKVDNHRGISAERSVTKICEFAWLLDRDDVVSAMTEAEYAQYGAPKLAAACKLMGWPRPETPEIDRMIEGLACTPDCMDGCGS